MNLLCKMYVRNSKVTAHATQITYRRSHTVRFQTYFSPIEINFKKIINISFEFLELSRLDRECVKIKKGICYKCFEEKKH